MVEFLVLQVKMGKITLDQVPEKYKESVRLRLNDNSEEVI